MPSPWIHPDWPAPRNVHAMVTTRHGPGVSAPPRERLNLGLNSGDAPEVVRNNRRALEQALDLPSAPRWLRQVHGTTVAELGPLGTGDEPCADAAMSRIPGTVLAILTADCLPVLLCRRDGRAIAAAHAGWRGLAAGIIEATLQTLATPGDEVLAWLGPCIGAASYEVDSVVRDAFLEADTESDQAFSFSRPGHWFCSLETLARRRLCKAGVSRIFGGGFDTFADPRFYSWRRDGSNSGRFASLIMLQPD